MAVFVCAIGWRDCLGQTVGDGNAQSRIRISAAECLFMLEQLCGVYISVCFTGMDDYSKLAMLSGIGPPILRWVRESWTGSRAILNWTCVTSPTPGPDSLLSNVVTLLVSVPHRLAICIFEE